METARLPVRQELPPAYFIRNRQMLEDYLGTSYLALLAAGRPPRRTADENYPFFANRNFFYLTGIEQENTLLLLYGCGSVRRHILFLPARDMLQERWTGARLSQEQAAARSGLLEIEPLSGFENVIAGLLDPVPQHVWQDSSAAGSQADDIRGVLAKQLPGCEIADIAPFLTQLRMIKAPEEIALLEQAIALTGRGIAALQAQIRPGAMEYQLWSHFNHTLALEGCLEPAFPTIVAAGENVFCLHYMQPRTQLQAGDILQIDVGATAGGLCADISRAFPVSGYFSPRQLAIYQLVRECQNMAFATIRPGVQIGEVNERCRNVAAEGLTALGILKAGEPVTEYFWHNVSHHLGLDVHDVANRDALLKPGMVLTVEPGIYVQEWQTGLRIEDDVLVTGDGCRVLSAAIPREAAEIEAAFAGHAAGHADALQNSPQTL